MNSRRNILGVIKYSFHHQIKFRPFSWPGFRTYQLAQICSAMIFPICSPKVRFFVSLVLCILWLSWSLQLIFTDFFKSENSASFIVRSGGSLQVALSRHVRSRQGQSSKLFKKVQLKLKKCPVLLWGSQGSAPGVVYNPLIGYLTLSLVNSQCEGNTRLAVDHWEG